MWSQSEGSIFWSCSTVSVEELAHVGHVLVAPLQFMLTADIIDSDQQGLLSLVASLIVRHDCISSWLFGQHLGLGLSKGCTIPHGARRRGYQSRYESKDDYCQ
jgi:hypothetical protein